LSSFSCVTAGGSSSTISTVALLALPSVYEPDAEPSWSWSTTVSSVSTNVSSTGTTSSVTEAAPWANVTLPLIEGPV